MLVETIKDYTDKETKLVYKTTDNCTIRRVSDVRGAELVAAGVVVEVKPEDEVKSEVETKSKSKAKKKDEVDAEDKTPEDVSYSSNGNFEDKTIKATEEPIENTKSE